MSLYTKGMNETLKPRALFEKWMATNEVTSSPASMAPSFKRCIHARCIEMQRSPTSSFFAQKAIRPLASPLWPDQDGPSRRGHWSEQAASLAWSTGRSDCRHGVELGEQLGMRKILELAMHGGTPWIKVRSVT